MDMSGPMGKMPVEANAVSIQRQAVVELITEIVSNADIVGHEKGGRTVYLLHLSPKSADTLASLFADLEDGDPLDAGELDPLDAGEEEHDGREPELEE